MNPLLKGLAVGFYFLAQATLPQGMASSDHSIAVMDVGESGWTVPWAMYHDKERHLWLNGAYPLRPASGGTAQMLVTRSEDGWHVNAKLIEGSYQWNEAGYVGAYPPIRVVEFVR